MDVNTVVDVTKVIPTSVDKVNQIWVQVQDIATVWGLKVIAAVAIFIIGRWIAMLVRRCVRRVMERAKVVSIITGFVSSIAYIALLAFVVIAALGQLGIQTTSFIAILGAAGLAIGLALQGSLANFAAGFLMIIFRPFKVGDFIEGEGVAGIVEEIQIFTTTLKTPDNKIIIVPNAKLCGGITMNATHKKTACGFLLSMVAWLSAQPATAAGFYIPEVGSPASLGTGGVANPTNTFGADAAWTNPAGMTGLQRDQIFSGVQAVIPRMEFDSSTATAGGSDGGNAGNTAIIPSFFYVNKLNDRTRLGISLVAPMGGGVNYGDDFVGRYQTSRAELAAVSLSPAIGYKVTDRFSVGAGVSFIYTQFEQKIAINQAALLGPGTPDGTVRLDNATDWGYQPFLGITWQFTDRALLGVVYRAKMDVKLEGDVNFRNLLIQKPGVNETKISWDNPQTLEAGLKYQLSKEDFLFLNAGWQDWSEFGNNELAFSGGTVATLDRQWDDTWHAGVAYAHFVREDSGYSVGFSYDSSPVDNKHRTFDLPVDETYKLSAAYFWKGSNRLDYSLGTTLYMIGDAKIDLTSQGVRAAGEFDTNYILFLGGTVRYRF